MIVGREREFNQIELLISNSITQQSSLSIYISGPPGTGKTATIKAVIQSLQRLKQREKKIRHVYIDCFSTFTISAICKYILDKLDATIHQNKRVVTIRTVEEHIRSAKAPILILLDEVDNLLSSKKADSGNIIFGIFNLTKQFPGKVIVIAISNTLDLIERILPKNKFSHPPKSIIFAAYSTDQLIRILEARLEKEDLDHKTLELCSRKVSSMTGDVRQALDIVAQILNDLKKEKTPVPLSLEEWSEDNKENIDLKQIISPSQGNRKRKGVSKERDEPQTPNLKRTKPIDKGELTPKKNACREVLNAINKTTASPCQRSKLPQHPAILLATLMRLIKNSSTSSEPMYRTPSRTPNGKNNAAAPIIPERLSVSIDRLFQAYIKVCERLFLRPLESDDLNSAYEVLESQAMIRKIKKLGRGGGEQHICLIVEMSLAYQAINDNALLASIENMSTI